MNAKRVFLLVSTVSALCAWTVFLTPGTVSAQRNAAQAGSATHGPWFTDNDGDGYHDYAPDHDGDGIPNGRDSDYIRPGRGGGRRGGRTQTLKATANNATGQKAGAASGKTSAVRQNTQKATVTAQGNTSNTSARGTWQALYGVQGWTRTNTTAHGPWFVDANNDGYHDYAPDHDGDGIPNGRDTDYKNLRLTVGSGQGTGRGAGRSSGGGRGGGRWR